MMAALAAATSSLISVHPMVDSFGRVGWRDRVHASVLVRPASKGIRDGTGTGPRRAGVARGVALLSAQHRRDGCAGRAGFYRGDLRQGMVGARARACLLR